MTTVKPATAPLSLAQLSLRERERGLVVGGVDTGKSTLMDMLGTEFVHRYARRGGRRLILDSKPRYRAAYTVHGVPATRRYRNWSHGQPLPGSMLVEDPEDLELAWKTGARTVIMQGESVSDRARLQAGASAFLRGSRANRPQLLQVDETMDFFHPNGAPLGGDDAITRAVRAGRERGTGALCGTQRTKGLPATLLEEMSRLYCLRIDFKADAKRLQEMGAPPFVIPTRPHEFMYWWKGDYDHVWGPYKLTLG